MRWSLEVPATHDVAGRSTARAKRVVPSMTAREMDKLSAVSPAVRRREEEDLGRCVRVLERVRVNDNYPVHWPDDASRWLSPRGTACAWVAEVERTIVGHVVLLTVAAGDAGWEAATGLHAGELGVVSRLFVDPDCRRAGVGGTLLDTAANEAVARGLHPVLDVIETRSSATRLFEQRGWRRVRTTPWSADAELAHHFYVGPKV
jgi:GNAT superfamily N-acetyltransferase